MGGQLAHKNHATVCGVVLFLECDCQSTNLRLGLVRWRRQNSGSLNPTISPVGCDRSRRIPQSGLSFELAQHPELIQFFAILVLAFELGFPLLLLIKSVKWRLAFILGVTTFHIATYVLMDVNLFLIPFVYLIFFDLVPIHQWLKTLHGPCSDVVSLWPVRLHSLTHANRPASEVLL
jgi:hypothetical protein